MLATENVPSLQAVEVQNMYMSTKSNCFMCPAGYAWQRIELVSQSMPNLAVGRCKLICKKLREVGLEVWKPKTRSPGNSVRDTCKDCKDCKDPSCNWYQKHKDGKERRKKCFDGQRVFQLQVEMSKEPSSLEDSD